MYYFDGNHDTVRTASRNIREAKYTPSLLSPSTSLAFDSRNRILILLDHYSVAQTLSLTPNEATIFLCLYNTFPEYAPDAMLFQALNPPHLSSTTISGDERVSKTISNLRGKLLTIDLDIKRITQRGYQLQATHPFFS